MRGTADETRKKILNAASKLFYENGIRSVGVDLVAETAGVTKRTLYYHFKSKDELIAAYLEARNEPVLAGLKSAIESANGSPADRVAALFDMLAAESRAPTWRGCPFARMAAELPAEQTHPARQIASDHKHAFETWLTGWFRAQGVGRSSMLAQQIIVLVDGAITQMLIHDDPGYAKASGVAARSLIDAVAGN